MSVLSRLGIAASQLDLEVKKFLRGLLATSTIAAAGSDQTDATAITTGRVMVTAADGAKGVILPVAEIDMAVEVVNTVSNQDLLVYPNTSAQINALTVTTGAFTVVAGASRTFFCDAALHWYTGSANLTGVSTTASTAELNVLDGAVAANATTGKAAILGTNGAITFGGAVTAVGSFIIGSADLAEADMEKLDGITNGTQAASKAIVNDANVNQGIAKVTELHIGATGAETQVTATGAELNALDGITADVKELNTLDKSVKSVLFDDFHGTWLITDAGPADQWSSTAGNGTTPVIATTVTAALNGEVTMKSASADGANSANNATFTPLCLAYQADQGGLANEVRVKIDDITEAYLFVGFTDVISTTVESPITFTDGTDTLIADAGDACGIVFTGDSTTQEWAQGGVKATAVTAGSFSGTAPVNDTYVVLRVEVSATGGCRGFVNGTAIAAETADAITATTAVTPSIVVGNTAAAQTIATIDYIKVEQNR